MFGSGEGQRYRGAVMVAQWLRIFGALALVGTVLGALTAISSGSDNASGSFVAVLVGGGLATSFVLAASYALDLLVDIANSLDRIDEKAEQRTRR